MVLNFSETVIQAWDTQYETWYYWNVNTMKVSWLNPDDPDAEITDPADKQKGGGGDFGQLRYDTINSRNTGCAQNVPSLKNFL